VSSPEYKVRHLEARNGKSYEEVEVPRQDPESTSPASAIISVGQEGIKVIARAPEINENSENQLGDGTYAVNNAKLADQRLDQALKDFSAKHSKWKK
jgi:hypothetical protein